MRSFKFPLPHSVPSPELLESPSPSSDVAKKSNSFRASSVSLSSLLSDSTLFLIICEGQRTKLKPSGVIPPPPQVKFKYKNYWRMERCTGQLWYVLKNKQYFYDVSKGIMPSHGMENESHLETNSNCKTFLTAILKFR